MEQLRKNCIRCHVCEIERTKPTDTVNIHFYQGWATEMLSINAAHNMCMCAKCVHLTYFSFDNRFFKAYRNNALSCPIPSTKHLKQTTK